MQVSVMGINPATTGIKDFTSPLPSVTLLPTFVLAESPLIACSLFYTESLLRSQKAVWTAEELAVHQKPQREQGKP